MSIARAPAKNPKVLNRFCQVRVFFIKDLKDLENGTTRFSIDIKVLTDLKRHRLTLANAGDRPPRYDKKNGS